jgi:hypothetical protein
MSLPLVVNPRAEADLAEAKAWYEGERDGLGEEFLECIDEAFEQCLSQGLSRPSSQASTEIYVRGLLPDR